MKRDRGSVLFLTHPASPVSPSFTVSPSFRVNLVIALVDAVTERAFRGTSPRELTDEI